LRAIQAQARLLGRVYVVDTASADGTPDLLRTKFADATHIRSDENFGSTDGLARGIAVAWDDGFAAYWLFDDDSPPNADRLEVLLAAQRDDGPSGIIGAREESFGLG
jgi:GT2 family glycosyltransferase